MEVKIINKSLWALPQYATPGSAGLDIRADVPKTIIEPGKRAMITTGLFPEIPEGYELQVRPRSGLAFKHGITVLNSPGTIDSDYRAEIGVILINHSDEPFIVEPGERIGQLVLAKVERCEWVDVEALTETARTGGFGSTGR